MGTGNKWVTAQQAIPTALDDDAFDSASLGLFTFPSAMVAGPACVFNVPVNCGVPMMPQIPTQLAGSTKSSATMGVRHDITQYLAGHAPPSSSVDPANEAPLYDAMTSAYSTLMSATATKRTLILVTDGGGSCTSISSPQRPGYVDQNSCPDWEEPPTVNALIRKWQTDPSTPVSTFVIGLPGSNSTGGMLGTFATAPYSMLLALSTYAVSGSPNTVDSACDSTAVFSQTAPAPAHPCHIDLSNAAGFTSASLASAIADVQSKALACTYALPTAPMGQTIDMGHVNVVVTVGGVASPVPRRASSAEHCSASPCWDYDPMGNVQLIGSECAAVGKAVDAKVTVNVGCATVTM
jgi:hypothetical protein